MTIAHLEELMEKARDQRAINLLGEDRCKYVFALEDAAPSLIACVRLLQKVRAHSAPCFVDGDHFAGFNARYLDEIDLALGAVEGGEK